MRSYRGMSPATTVFTALYDTFLSRPVGTMSMAQIQQARTRVNPTRPPLSWVADRVAGAVEKRVGVSYGTAQARDGYEVPLRIYRPRSARDTDTDLPVVLYLHGGGWVLGNVVGYDPLCTALAAGVRALVVSVDYRLAPEHPAPTAVHDCVDAARWLIRRPDVLRADTGRVAVCGDSAGGNLAAVLAQVLRDDGGSPLRHQALLYPAVDLTRSSASIREHAHAPILDKADIDAFHDHYLAGSDERDPLVSPLFGVLEGLPPALVQTADLDPLRDDGIRYAHALQAAGVPVRLSNYLRTPHGFASFPGVVPCGWQSRAELVGELRSHLYAAERRQAASDR